MLAIAMENRSDPIAENNETICLYFINLRARLGTTFDLVSLIVGVVNMISAPLAVAGKALVLKAIWKNPPIKTPSYVLLAGLAGVYRFLYRTYHTANLSCIQVYFRTKETVNVFCH